MNNQFSQKVSDIIVYSKEEANRLKSSYIGPEHLLLGMLRDGEGKAIEILSKLKTNLTDIKKQIEAILKEHADDMLLPDADVPLSNGAAKILKLCILEARVMKSQVADTEHVLLAILKDKDNLAATVLEANHVNYQQVFEQLSLQPDISAGMGFTEDDDDEEEEAFDNPTRLDRLKPYLQTPRDMETPFFRAVAGNSPWLFKDRWKKKYTESPVIYAAVVQANSALWRPGDNDYYPAVFVFALDKKHIHDVEWLSQMAEKISELSDSPTVPDDCRKLINTLRDSQSEFCFRIGKSVSGDADAWCATYKFDKQSALPRKALPSDGIVPFLLKANPVENQFVDFKLIPSELYIG